MEHNGPATAAVFFAAASISAVLQQRTGRAKLRLLVTLFFLFTLAVVGREWW